MSVNKADKATRIPSIPSTKSDSPTEYTSFHSLDVELKKYLDRTTNADLLVYPGVERIEYDFIAERQNVYATNLVESTAHLIKGCLGAGILGIHEGYMHGGLLTSLVTNVALGIMVGYNMLLLVDSAQRMYTRLRVPKLTYADLIEVVIATGPLKFLRNLSKVFRYSVDFFLLVGFCSTCCIFEIMIAQTIKQFMEAISSTIKNWHLPITIYILLVAVPLLFISMIRSLKHLAPFSLIGDVFCGICVLITIYYSILERKADEARPAWKSFRGFFSFCGICIYSLDGIGVALPIENSMAKPQYFYIVVQWGMSIVILAVASVGFFGYWSWGEASHSPITVHMPKDDAFTALQFLLFVTLAVTFSVHLWVPFRTLWRYISKRYDRNRGHWERLFRGIYVLVITCMSIIFSDLSEWMSFVGSFFLGTIVFIFPAFIDSMVIWDEHNYRYLRLKLFGNMAIIVMGIISCCGAMYSLIK